MASVLPKSISERAEESAARRPLARVTSLIWVIVIAIVLAFCFFASSLCITFILAAFLAILAEPLVTWMERYLVSRSACAALVILCGVLLLGGAGYASYDKVNSFVDRLPRYAEKLRGFIKPLSSRVQKVQESAGRLDPTKQKTPVVRVSETPLDVTPYLVRGVGSVGGAIIVGAVVPFLMFFMLVRKEHLYWWFSTTLGKTTDVGQFTERAAVMVRAFVIGNLIVGAMMAAVVVPILFTMGLDGAVGLGIVSGFLNLVPYLGALLACLPPLVAATLQFNRTEPFLIIALAVILLHIISANLLIPRFVGSRVNLDPVAAIAGMLFWTWLWGAFGLLLAVPLTAFVKLVADCHPALAPVANLLAKNPRPASRWARAREATWGRAIPYIRDRFRTRP